MATFRIPNRFDQVRQLNGGETRGELAQSKNIDLSTSVGKIKLARPVAQVMNDTQLSGDAVEAIQQFKSFIYALTDNELYRDSAPYDNFAVEGTSISSGQDLAVFNGVLLVSENTNIGAWNGASYDNDYWTTVLAGSALTTGAPHVLHTIRVGGKDTLAVTDGNQLRYYNATAGHTSFSWDAELIACCLASGLSDGWIGTFNESGGGAEVIRWRVGDDQYLTSYPVNANAILSMDVIDGIPYIVTERGEIQKFNNAGFTTIATIPMWNKPEFLAGVETGLIQQTNTLRPVHPKGLRRYGDNLLLNINTQSADSSDNVNELCPAGVWEIDPNTGSCWHRFSVASDAVTERSSPVYVINDRNGRIYFSGQDRSSSNSLFREDLAEAPINYGYFVTAEFASENVEDVYQNLVIAALQEAGQRIVVKYRQSKSTTVPFASDVVWISPSQFSTSDDLSAIADGNEVEILYGAGAGQCAHITDIERTATLYLVTIDTALGVANATSHAQFDNWIKVEDPYDTTALVKDISIGVPSTSMQFKVYMQGANGFPQINRLVVKTEVQNSL